MNLKPQWLAPFLPPPPCPQLCPYFYISIYYIILKLFMYLLLLETISHSSLNVLLIYKIHWRIVKTWTLNDNHNRMKLESLQHKESSGKKKSLMPLLFGNLYFANLFIQHFLINIHTHFSAVSLAHLKTLWMIFYLIINSFSLPMFKQWPQVTN